MDKRQTPQKVGTALSRVSELRIKGGGYTYEEAAAAELGGVEASTTSTRTRAKSVDHDVLDSSSADNKHSEVARSSEILSTNYNNSTLDIGSSSFITVAIDEENDATLTSSLPRLKRSYPDGELSERLSKYRKTS